MMPSTAPSVAAVWAAAAAATESRMSSDSKNSQTLRALAGAASAVHAALEADEIHLHNSVHAALSAALAALTAPQYAPLREDKPELSTRHSAGSAVTVESEEEDRTCGSLLSLPVSQTERTNGRTCIVSNVGAETTTYRRVVALFPFTAAAPNELDLRQGDVVEVLSTHASGWWTGRSRSGLAGFFPSNYCRPLSESEESRLLRKRYARRARRAESRSFDTLSLSKTAPSTPRAVRTARETQPQLLQNVTTATPAGTRRSAECA